MARRGGDVTPAVDAAIVTARITAMRRRIAQHATRPVRLVAVTKRFGVDAVEAALDAGVHDIGENYAQELLDKRHALLERRPGADVVWHFIGRLQRNKVRGLAGAVGLWHTLDGLRIGEEIARRDPGARVLVQVNAAGTPGQGGVELTEVAGLVASLRRLDLRVEGLMAMGRMGDRAGTAELFADLRARADDLGLPECSMGMSDDLDEALAAGATIVRVGSAIFGARPSGPPTGPVTA